MFADNFVNFTNCQYTKRILKKIPYQDKQDKLK